MYYDYYQRIQHNPNMDYQGQPPYYYPTPSVANYDNLAYISIIKWIMVKNFEFMNVYDLQDEGNVYSDPNWSDKRRWYKNRVFFTAPHVTGVPEIYPQWGSESASWYQLAQILNSGNRYAWDQDPLDQGYLAGFGNQFLPYKLYSRMPDQSIIWYKDWTNRTYGITMINTIKLLENSERGSNFPAPYKWPVYYLGYNPYGHMFGISQAVGEAVLFNYTDPQIQINWLSIWANKFYELVIRYSSNQWAEGEQSGNLYDALKVTETSLKNLKSQFGINITDDTINKVIAARKHIRPNLP